MNSSSVWIPPVFLAVAAWFLFGAEGEELPIPPAVHIPEGSLSKAPARRPLSDPPTISIGSHEQRCSDCHALFESDPESPDGLLQHAEIRLDHGLNDRCLNCHSTNDRDKLILQGTREIGFDEVVQLCAKCHGPTFRDWSRGIHGKTIGSWDRENPAFRRLGCTECHDPHAPAFDGIAPLPGPRTLRMGEHPKHVPHTSEDRISPLMRWLSTGEPSDGSGSDEPSEHEGKDVAHPEGHLEAPPEEGGH